MEWKQQADPAPRWLSYVPALGAARGLGVGPALVAVYVVVVPVAGAVVPGFGLFDGQRLLQLLVLGVVAASLIVRGTRARWLAAYVSLPVTTRWSLAVLLGAGCVSASLAPLPRFAFLEVGMFVLLFIGMVALLGVFRSDPSKASLLVLAVLAAGASFYVLSFLVGFVFSLTSGFPVWPQGFTGFAHVRLFNQYQVWTLPLLVLPASLLPVQSRVLRGGLYVLPALWYALLFASGGRGATLALVGALLLVALLYRWRAVRWLRLQGAAALGGGVLYVLLFVVLADNLSVFTRLQELGQDSGRFDLWARAWGLIVRHPLLGEGPMQFARTVNEHAAHPHNALLQWAAEWGTPSACLLVGVLGWGFVAWVRDSKRAMRSGSPPDRDLLVVALTASLAAATAYALVDGITVMPLSQFLLVTTVAWVLALHRSDPPVVVPRCVSRWASRGLLLVVALAGLGVGGGIYRDVSALPERQADHLERTGTRLLHPRFWHQGFTEP